MECPVERLAKLNVRLDGAVTEENWSSKYHGVNTFLPLHCTDTKCPHEKKVIMTTSIHNALRGSLGCLCRVSGHRAARWAEEIKKRVESEFHGKIEVNPEYKLHRVMDLNGTFFMYSLVHLEKNSLVSLV